MGKHFVSFVYRALLRGEGRKIVGINSERRMIVVLLIFYECLVLASVTKISSLKP